MNGTGAIPEDVVRGYLRSGIGVVGSGSTDLWLGPEVGEVCDHVVEDRVVEGSAGLNPSCRSLLLRLLNSQLRLLIGLLRLLIGLLRFFKGLLWLVIALLRLVGRIGVTTLLLLLLLLIVPWIARVGGVLAG